MMVCFAARITAQTAITCKTIFVLPERRRGNRKPFGGSDIAQPENHNLPPDNNHRHPAGHQVHFHQGNKCGGHQKFIGDGIEQNSERSDFAPPPGIVAIRPIRGRSGQKNEHAPLGKINCHSQKCNIGLAGQKDNDQHRDKENA